MQPNPTTTPTFEQAAAYKVDRSFADLNCELLELFTCPDAPSDPLPPGVSAAEVEFTRDQRAEAIAWTAAVLKARWVVFRGQRIRADENDADHRGEFHA
jgi:hypothetical protein